VAPEPDIIRPNKAIRAFINKNNNGCGLILVHDRRLNTTAVFCGDNVPQEKWERLVDAIKEKEGESLKPGEGEPEDCGCRAYALNLARISVGLDDFC
jgi:hypothetical protein